jgi:UDP-N-acetylglucosamine 2-epimerase (non-hydrolysing)
MDKIAVIFGTRPEAIKMAPVIKTLQKYPKRFKIIICLTAQHRDLLDEVLRLFEIRADYDLDIMEENQSPFEVTSKGLLGVRGILKKENPDFVLVQGDTTNAFTSALAAFYLKIPVGHIEAGLRTNDKFQPFPEEINRRLISQIADFHFAPAKQAEENLISEGIPKDRVFLTGNTVIDALFYISRKVKDLKILTKRLSFLRHQPSARLILVTAHRRENFNAPLRNICLALKKIVSRNNDLIVVYPLHPNPNVKGPVEKILGKINRIKLIPPLDYASFVYLMSRAYLILTDSGGIQEEATALGKPLLIMREKTERPEAIREGVAKLVGTDIDSIVRNAEILLNSKKTYKSMAKMVYPFGNGKAAEKIIKIIKDKI